MYRLATVHTDIQTDIRQCQ